MMPYCAAHTLRIFNNSLEPVYGKVSYYGALLSLCMSDQFPTIQPGKTAIIDAKGCCLQDITVQGKSRRRTSTLIAERDRCQSWDIVIHPDLSATFR